SARGSLRLAGVQGRRVGTVLIAAGALLVAPASAVAVPSVTGEFPMPAGVDVGSNNEIAQGPDGNMWITVQGDAALVKVTPDGTVTKETSGGLAQEANGIVEGPNNTLWAAQSAGVVKITPGPPMVASQENYG